MILNSARIFQSKDIVIVIIFMLIIMAQNKTGSGLLWFNA